jgi:hypothetical protein
MIGCFCSNAKVGEKIEMFSIMNEMTEPPSFFNESDVPYNRTGKRLEALVR